jgi:sugar phosphate isomerase/epimerase
MIKFIYAKAEKIGCKLALYNHHGWFGDPNNQIKIIKTLPECQLSIVYNFHHAHDYIEDIDQIFKKIKPYLSAVNLNGMQKQGPKILPIGQGDQESRMIRMLINEGYEGPWGILGHVDDADVKKVLEKNIEGLNSLELPEL